MTVERRYTTLTVEVRSRPDTAPKIGGYAAVFNKLSDNLGGFVEQVAPSFFNRSRGRGWPGVIARYNHDDNMLLGTTGSGTLTLTVDETGLLYEVTPPDARADVLQLVERGDVRHSSFAWAVRSTEDEWDVTDQGYPRRTLHSGELVDVSPVNSPAYGDTTAALRSLATKVEAELDVVKAAAEANELRKFFTRSDGPAAPKPHTFGPAALASLMENPPV